MHLLLACRSDPVVGEGEPGLNRLDKEDTAEAVVAKRLNPHLKQNSRIHLKQIVYFFFMCTHS